jgi:hypothetical protein
MKTETLTPSSLLCKESVTTKFETHFWTFLSQQLARFSKTVITLLLFTELKNYTKVSMTYWLIALPYSSRTVKLTTRSGFFIKNLI